MLFEVIHTRATLYVVLLMRVRLRMEDMNHMLVFFSDRRYKYLVSTFFIIRLYSTSNTISYTSISCSNNSFQFW